MPCVARRLRASLDPFAVLPATGSNTQQAVVLSDWIWTALGLTLVLEGLLPFLSPGGWRKAFERALQLSDGQIRFLGLCSLGAGLALLWFMAPG